ncbi:monooxygenase [Xylariaceae sp. FL0804]|nr:monooxygenase [Xylariaceae sp. FL0804]
MTVMPLGELVRLLHRRCEALGADVVDVRFSHRVVAVGQDGDRAWVDVEVGGEEEEEEGSEGEKEGEKKKKKKKRIERFEADYVVGCDGGTSTVRKELYGREWPGQTFDCQFIVQNVWYDGFAKHGWDGGNYMIGPDSWGLVAKRGNTGMWRVTMGDKPGLSEAEYLARRPAHLARLLPGHPSSPDQYRVGDTNMYRVHNRCVPSMRAGRVLLAADAAHVCNPMGGLGCMTALVDVDGLASCLAALRDGRAGDEILDVWARVRREKFLRYVDRRSVMNLDRVSRFDPWTVGDTDPFFDLIREHEHDAEKRRAFLLKVQSIEYDFKQHFKTP